MFKRTLLLLIILVLGLAACGGDATPEAAPTDVPATEEPTDIPEPTNTPEPTIDPASYTAEQLQATVEALEEEIEREEEHLSSASGMEAGNVQTLIDQLQTELREVRELLDAAQSREGGADDDAADDSGDDMADDDNAADDDAMDDDAEDDDAMDDDEAADEDSDDMAADDEAAAGPMLTLDGDFAEARDWAWDELAGLEMITATVVGPREDDPEVEYTGVSLNALLEVAGIGEDATTLVATASDGFEGEIALADVQDCAECMVVQDDDMLRLVMPNFGGSAWVRGVVSLNAE